MALAGSIPEARSAACSVRAARRPLVHDALICRARALRRSPTKTSRPPGAGCVRLGESRVTFACRGPLLR